MDDVERQERAKVVAVTLSFLRTPYRDCGRVKGLQGGVDCATLLAMVFEEAGLEPQPVEFEPYSPQWYLHRDEERYLKVVESRAAEIAEADALPADIVLYRFGRCFSHGAIIIDPGFPAIVHAFKQDRMVVIGEGLSAALTFMNDGKPRPRRFFRHRAWGR